MDINIITLTDAFVSVGKIKKLLANIRNLKMLKFLKSSELYVANDQSILFLLALKFKTISRITLIDEGALHQLILRERLAKKFIWESKNFVLNSLIGRKIQKLIK